MQVDAGVAAPDAALLSLLLRKKVSKETHPNALPAARVPGAEKMNVGRAKTRLRLKQFALLIDVNPFVTGGGNRGGKSKAGTIRQKKQNPHHVRILSPR